MRTLILLLAATLAGAAGCGSSVVNGTGGGTTTTGTGTGTAHTCPAAEPSGGSSCAGLPSGLHCTYGSSVRAECRDEWICNGGTWTTTKGVCLQPPPGDCSTQPTDGAVCPTQGDVCTYGNTICLCSECPSGPCMTPPPTWTCTGAPPTPGCPPVVPNDGTPCTMNGLQCTYGFPCSGAGAPVLCKNGAWLWDTMFACAN